MNEPVRSPTANQPVRSPTATGQRLQKILARSGLGSRRMCEEIIAKGRASVNGEIVTLGARVEPEDSITVDGIPVITDTALVYYLLHKPIKVVTTASDPEGRRTVMEFVDPEPRVFPVGRLDYDTSGLIVMTNDGELANRLTHPRHGVDKVYVAEIEGHPTPGVLQQLRRGVQLDDGVTSSARCRVIDRGETTAVLEIILHEGRNRQVRRMCEALGHPVITLMRTRIAEIRDVNLAPGQMRALTTKEVRSLYSSAS